MPRADAVRGFAVCGCMRWRLTPWQDDAARIFADAVLNFRCGAEFGMRWGNAVRIFDAVGKCGPYFRCGGEMRMRMRNAVRIFRCGADFQKAVEFLSVWGLRWVLRFGGGFEAKCSWWDREVGVEA